MSAAVDPFGPEAMTSYGYRDGYRDALEGEHAALDETEDGPEYVAGYHAGFAAALNR